MDEKEIKTGEDTFKRMQAIQTALARDQVVTLHYLHVMAKDFYDCANCNKTVFMKNTVDDSTKGTFKAAYCPHCGHPIAEDAWDKGN